VKIIISLVALLVFALPFTALPLPADDKQLVGWLEKVCIYPGNLVIHAKLDTGAKYSSLNASHLTEFTRNGEQWVRFKVTSRYGKTVTFERKVQRVAKIKRHGARPQIRFAIRLGICLGSSYEEAEVNLVDRSDFNYQMLIGRSFLKDKVIIDPSLKYTTKPICKGISRQ
jgi:hypothetical protein